MTLTARLHALKDLARRRYALLLLAILALGVLLRVATYLDLAATDQGFFEPSLDSQEFLRWAREIAGGDFLGDRPFFLNPLYPYFIAPITALAGDHTLIVIRLVQGILGIATILLIAGATRRFAGPGTALIAALITAAYPLVLAYEQKVMIVALALFLNALTLYALALLMDRPTPLRAVLAGLPLGVCVLARPNVVLFAMLLPLWFLSIAPGGRRLRFAVGRTALLALGVLLAVLPVTYRNWHVGKDLVFVTSSMGANLYQSNNPEAWRTGWMASNELRLHPVQIENDAIVLAERELERKLKPSEVSSYWADRAIKGMKASPGKAFGFLARKFFFFFRGFEVPSSYYVALELKHSGFLRFIPLNFTLLAPLMLLGAVIVLARNRRAAPLVLLVVAYAVGLTIFFPLSHYRAPILPAAIPLAAIALACLAEFVAEGRRRLLVGGLLVLLCAVLICQATEIAAAVGVKNFAGKKDDLVTYHYNRGMFLVGKGKLDEAEDQFKKAIEANPDSWMPHLGLAAIADNRGELANEAVHLRHALDRNPGSGDLMVNLGRNMVDRGMIPEGLALAEEAVKLSPRSESVRLALAVIYLNLDRFEDAIRELRLAEDAAHYPVPEILADLSYCMRKLDRHGEARAEVDRGLVVEPKNVPLLTENLWILVETAPDDVGAIRKAAAALSAVGGEVPEEIRTRFGL